MFSTVRSVLTSLVSLTLVLAAVISESSSIFVPGSAVAGGLADNPPTKSFLVPPGQAKKLEYDGATLDIGADAVAVETTISITPLNQEDLPALSLGMANTTTEPRRGYRFLPHGMKFQKPIEVALPYNKDLIPEGLTEKDIETFYFDDQIGSWQKLERIAVDTEKMLIISLTNHFTDMINATVTVPEHAQPLALDPNSMKDVEAADPSAGINLIEAPGVSNMGDARLTYSIEVPPGRRGMQPQLVINYSSGASNGWLGLGWDLVIPTVTIDTRWGVPRYDVGNETETYLLNGEQLTPVAHRDELQPRSSDKKFHTRVEGQFREIIRHGSSPSDYWWEVIDREGTRYLYGGDVETNGLVAGAILANENGDIFRWGLSEVRDPNGNGIQYTYVRVDDTGLENGTITGYQLYLKSINYTQSNGQPGSYTVTLVRDRELSETRRTDVIIDARGGFKMVTADLLRRIEVQFNGDLIRAYQLGYRCSDISTTSKSEECEETGDLGAFDKTLLRSIAQYGEDGSFFNEHVFEYFDDVREVNGTYQGFGTPADWNTGADNVTAGLLNHGQASALGGSINSNVGGHLYVGFNVQSPTKQFSAGGKVGYTHGDSEGVLALMDIDGDSLPDKVFRQGNSILFRRNESGPDGGTSFGQSLRPITGLPALSQETSNQFSFGGEVYYVANVFANHSETYTTGSIYFSDVNGDGLPDLINNNQVLFNHLDSNGIPTFTAASSDTPVPISTGVVDVTNIIDDAEYQALFEEQVDIFPLHDTLRRWVAPFNGQISITGPVALIEDTSSARANYQTADGVRVAIQHNSSELWSTTIGASDYDPKTPANVDAISVSAGDHIYFRVQSVFDGAYDRVNWDPQIDYLGVSSRTDVNGLNPYRYQASEDFVLAGRRGIHVQLPLDGKVRLIGDLQKNGVTTDDVALLVFKNGTQLFSSSLAWDTTGSISLDQEISVLAEDIIQLRVRVDSPIDLGRVQWTPDLFYIETADPNQRIQDDAGEPIFRLTPPYDVDMYPNNNLTVPQDPWIVPKTGTVQVIPQLSAVANDANGQVTFTVKRRNEQVAKHTIPIIDGVVNNPVFNMDVTKDEELFFDYAAYDPELQDDLADKTVKVVYTEVGSVPMVVPSAFHGAAFPGLFAQPYRGWASAGYNGNVARAAEPIHENDLNQTFSEDSPVDDDPEAAKDFLLDAKVYLFNPFPAENAWRGPDNLGWVQAGKMSSSRLGLDFISVPQTSDFDGAHAVPRLSRGSQTAIGAGISFLSGSYSTGNSEATLDYLDMNGDLFPDVVGEGRVHYTSMLGGLREEGNKTVPGLMNQVRESDNDAWNLGVGGSPASFTSGATGKVDTDGKAAPKSNNTGSQMASLGLSAGLGAGTSDLSYEFMDINGDGLPDQLHWDGSQLMVSLNLGYAFTAEPEPWGVGSINDGASESGVIGASLGYNDGTYGFSGGVSLDKNKSETSRTLLDINGDGLLDQITSNDSQLRVRFNTGNGFTNGVDWLGALDGVCNVDTDLSLPVRQVLEELGIDKVEWDSARICNANTGLGVGVYFTIGIGPLCWPTSLCYIIINPGNDGSQNMARQEATISDVDGDGYADHIASGNDSQMLVAQNQTGRTNLLESVDRPLGGRIELDYQRTGNIYDLPQSRWVLSRVIQRDGHPGDGVDSLVTTYQYEAGLYDRLEREFYGFAKVIEDHRNAASGEDLYRSVVHEYRNDTFYTRGLQTRELTQDAAGRPYLSIEHTYKFRDVTLGTEPADPSVLLQSTTATVFPELTRTDRHYFEGNPVAAKETHTTNEYDEFGNIVRFFDAADISTQDDVLATISYSTTIAPCVANYIVGKAMQIVITSGGVELRRREGTVDCSTGNLTQVRQHVNATDVAVTDLAYFANGNLQQVINPPNNVGQRYTLTYEYDPVVATHVSQITDSFGYSSSATYHLKYGRPETTTDTNNNQTTYTYDAFGRTATVTGPYEQSGGIPTIRFAYHHDAIPGWAFTQEYDPFRDPTGGDPVDTVIFVDGFTRVIQVKRDSTLHDTPDTPPQDAVIVSGRRTFDFVGRTAQEFYPTTEPLGSPGVFNASVDQLSPIRTEYDILDRTTKVTLPDDTTTTTTYGFGLDRNGATHFETTVIDASDVKTQTYRDVRDLATSVKQFNAGEIIWTSYSYDPVRQLSLILDDKDNETRLAYDNLGRRTSVDSPDGGKTDVIYDLSANMIAKITANLRAQGQQITYLYEFNRVTNIIYPHFSENNVTYAYGDPGASFNRAGRIVRVIDESGEEERFYGKLGEVIKEIKSIASDTGRKPKVYTTEYRYDTFGRLQSLTYPDGEILTYKYNAGGLVSEATGQKGSFTYPYITRLEYDKFDQRTFVETANGIRTEYSYNPLTRRLANLQAGKLGSTPFQNLLYVYDNVGNILSLSNNIPVPPSSEFGGPTSQTIQYDDLDRLISSQGSYQFAPDKTNRYSLTLNYDTIHNVLAKTQAHEIVQPSGVAISQHKTSYDWEFDYLGVQPHAVTHIGDRSFTYDANGNQSGWTHDRNGTRRTIIWDEENRVQSIFDNGHEKTYKYDDQGERVIKRGPQGETAYVNPNFTIRNAAIGTKHIYAGTTRMVSKLMKKESLEKDQYFYHPDHLGSSNYVTDADGVLFEHLEYFPFGETWVQEASNTQRTPYLFTSKELDEETDLYYYGARYYDPRVSQFLSVDPILFTEPEKATGMPEFLGTYNYAVQNPMTYKDPDGRDIIIALGHDHRRANRSQWQESRTRLVTALTRGGLSRDRIHFVSLADGTGGIRTKAQEIQRSGRQVSAFVYIGHGTREGRMLPRLRPRAQRLQLSVGEAVNQAQVAPEGAVVAFACLVCNGVNAGPLRQRQIRLYGTAEYVYWNDRGQVYRGPEDLTKEQLDQRTFVDPGSISLPEFTNPLQGLDNPDPLPQDPPTVAEGLLQAERRVNPPNQQP